MKRVSQKGGNVHPAIEHAEADEGVGDLLMCGHDIGRDAGQRPVTAAPGKLVDQILRRDVGLGRGGGGDRRIVPVREGVGPLQPQQQVGDRRRAPGIVQSARVGIVGKVAGQVADRGLHHPGVLLHDGKLRIVAIDRPRIDPAAGECRIAVGRREIDRLDIGEAKPRFLELPGEKIVTGRCPDISDPAAFQAGDRGDAAILARERHLEVDVLVADRDKAHIGVVAGGEHRRDFAA